MNYWLLIAEKEISVSCCRGTGKTSNNVILSIHFKMTMYVRRVKREQANSFSAPSRVEKMCWLAVKLLLTIENYV